jgi:hypothetical protein
MAFELRYRSMVYVEALAENECTIHRAVSANGARYWLLWIYARRVDNGQLDDFAVPVIPNGSYTEEGPGGKSWGLVKVADGEWQISPSIHVTKDKEVNARLPDSKSLWHETPRIVGVSKNEPWML